MGRDLVKWAVSVKKIIAHVDPDLRELIPGYLQNRRNDIKAISTALKDADLIKIRTLGHSMKGSGGGYGFMPISVIGLLLKKRQKKKPRMISKLISMNYSVIWTAFPLCSI